MQKIKPLSFQKERELLTLAQKGKDKEKEDAIRILICHNESLVKHFVKRYFSFANVNYEDLVAEGIRSLPKAIEKFDLDSKYRFAVYAGCWIKQYIRTYIEKTQFIKKSVTNPQKKNITYYDSNYQNEDKESKSYSLVDILKDREDYEMDNEKIRQHDINQKINRLVNSLENPEMILLIRLLYSINPHNLLDIYYLATEEEKKVILKTINLPESKRAENSLTKYSCYDKKAQELLVVQKYCNLFTNSYKFPEIAQVMKKSESYIRKLKQTSFSKLQKLAQNENLHFLI